MYFSIQKVSQISQKYTNIGALARLLVIYSYLSIRREYTRIYIYHDGYCLYRINIARIRRFDSIQSNISYNVVLYIIASTCIRFDLWVINTTVQKC